MSHQSFEDAQRIELEIVVNCPSVFMLKQKMMQSIEAMMHFSRCSLLDSVGDVLLHDPMARHRLPNSKFIPSPQQGVIKIDDPADKALHGVHDKQRQRLHPRSNFGPECQANALCHFTPVDPQNAI